MGLLVKCSNCDSDALFVYRVTLTKSVLYCNKHLPKFLEARKQANLLMTTDKFEEAKQEAIQQLSSPEPVVEEKPKKKTAKKKAE